MMRDEVVKWIHRIEGGYVNDPLDRGGETNMGITWKTLNEAHSNGIVSHNNVGALEENEVNKIYWEMYWKPCKADKMPQHLDWVHFDSAVNHGSSRAGRLLQQTINYFGHSTVIVDGGVGPYTLSALNVMVGIENIDDTIEIQLEFRAKFYHKLVQKYPEQNRFLKGWMNRIKWLKQEVGI